MKTTHIITSILLILSLTIFAQNDVKSKMAPLEVLVTDYNNNAKKGEQLLFEGITSGKIFKGISNENGKFDINLLGGDTYLIKIKSIGKDQDYNKIEIPKLNEGELYSKGQLTIKFELPKTFTLNNVHFDSGKPTLTKKSYAELSDLLEYMKLKDELSIEIAGHTDNIGEHENNLTLSQKRAETVRNYLISKGIKPNRVTAKGYGEDYPIDTNSTVTGRQNNRRTEVRVLE